MESKQYNKGKMKMKWLIEYSFGKEMYIRTFDTFIEFVCHLSNCIQAPTPISYYKVWIKKEGNVDYTVFVTETLPKKED